MMRFSHSDECLALIESAARFVNDHYSSPEFGNEPDATFNAARWREFAEFGWLAIIVDEQAGGLSGGPAMLSALAQAMGPGAIPEPLLSQCALGGYMLNALGNATKGQNLDAWLSGDSIVGFAHFEARNDRRTAPSALSTAVSGCGGEYRLNGAKTTVLDGGAGDVYLVSAATSDGSAVLVLVDKDRPGLEATVHPLFDGRQVSELSFTEVTLEATDIITLDGGRDAIIDEALLLHDFALAAESLGIAHSLVDITHDYLLTREQFGTTLADFQALQHRLVDMQLSIVRFDSLLVLARLKIEELGLIGATRFIRAVAEGIANLGRNIGREAVQLHGGIGMTDELVVGRYLKRLTANELLVR